RVLFRSLVRCWAHAFGGGRHTYSPAVRQAADLPGNTQPGFASRDSPRLGGFALLRTLICSVQPDDFLFSFSLAASVEKRLDCGDRGCACRCQHEYGRRLSDRDLRGGRAHLAVDCTDSEALRVAGACCRPGDPKCSSSVSRSEERRVGKECRSRWCA